MKKIFIYVMACFSILISCLSSCKKEQTSKPSIQITAPAPGQSFRVGDTILISAQISHDKNIQSASARLLNSNYIPVEPDQNISVSGTHPVVHFLYAVDDHFLATGNYYIEVSASDGTETTNEFVSIHITELPKLREGVFILRAAGNFSFNIDKADSLHNTVPAIQVSGDYSGACVYSVNHELFTIGKTTGAFNGFDLQTNTLLFSHPATSTIFPTFRNLYFAEDIIFVSYDDGNIKGYDKTGAQVYAVQQQGYFIPGVLFKNNLYVFAELYYPAFHQNKMGVFYLVSGAGKQESPVTINLANMYAPDQNHLLLFGNDSSSAQGKISLYTITGNGSNDLHSIPSGYLHSAVQVDSDHYFISHAGGIYLYDYSMNSLTPYVTGSPVYSMEYDDVNLELFAASGNHVNVYDVTTGLQKYVITSPDSVMDVKLLFNK
ncbi:MAG: hypothetical protein NT126_08810 [Bacteroidetes bacterium]|nr:hypothetical protein [Bacteroidota bacterium]